MKSKAVTYVRRAVLVFLGIALVALLLVNGLLNSGLPTKMLNDAQDDIHVAFTFAWVWWPTRVTVWGAEVRGNDSHVEWLLTAERATTGFSPMEAFDRVLRAHGAHATGITFRARGTRKLEDLCTTGSRVLPPIPSRANPVALEEKGPTTLGEEAKRDCLAQQETAHMPAPSDTSKLWQIDLHEMEAEDVKELWVEGFHYEGSARALGGFYLWPGLRVHVEPSTLVIESGSMLTGRDQALDELSGKVNIEVGPLDVEGLSAATLLKATRLSAALDAHVPDVGFTRSYLSKAKWLKLSGGEGKVHAEGKIEEGQILPESRIELTTKRLQAHFLDNVATGTGRLRFQVDERGDKRTGTLHLGLASYSMAREGDGQPHIKGKNLELTVRTREPTLGEPLDISGARLQVPNATVPDFSYYNAYIPRGIGLKILSGSATVAADIDVRGTQRLDKGQLTMFARGVMVQYKKLRIRGDIGMTAPLSAADLNKIIFDIPGSKLRLDNVSVIDQNEKPEDGIHNWWGTIELSRGRIRPSYSPFLSAAVKMELRDIRPLLAIYAVESGLPKWIQGLLSAEGAKGSMDVHVGDDLMIVDHFSLSGSGLTAQARARFAGEEKRGALLLSYGGHAIEIELQGDRTSLSILNATSKFYEGAKEKPVQPTNVN